MCVPNSPSFLHVLTVSGTGISCPKAFEGHGGSVTLSCLVLTASCLLLQE